MSQENREWYADGLRFACTRCGSCCTGFPGTVAVSHEESVALAESLEIDLEEFGTRYTRVLGDGSISLREKSNYDCVFYAHGHGCMVYENRPTQCRTWPFWRANVRAPGRWAEEARTCPGMNRGRLYTIEEIEERASKTP